MNWTYGNVVLQSEVYMNLVGIHSQLESFPFRQAINMNVDQHYHIDNII